MLRRPIPAWLLAAAFAVGASGCGAGTPALGADQPTHQGSLVAGELAGVPKPPGTVAFGPPTMTNGVATQSFKVTALPPGSVLRFYLDNLPAQGWTRGEPLTQAVDKTWRATWIRPGRRLLVTAEPDVDDGTGNGNDGLGNGNGAYTAQLDLELHPA
jgi:hypothetical protein